MKTKPSPLEVTKTIPIAMMVKYCAMMDTYANKVRKLLPRGWTSPYGAYGTWECKGR